MTVPAVVDIHNRPADAALQSRFRRYPADRGNIVDTGQTRRARRKAQLVIIAARQCELPLLPHVEPRLQLP